MDGSLDLVTEGLSGGVWRFAFYRSGVASRVRAHIGLRRFARARDSIDPELYSSAGVYCPCGEKVFVTRGLCKIRGSRDSSMYLGPHLGKSEETSYGRSTMYSVLCGGRIGNVAFLNHRPLIRPGELSGLQAPLAIEP